MRPFRSFQCICVLTLLAVAAPGMTPAPGPVADEASIARTADALGPGFRRSETARFVVLSDGSPEWTRGTSRLLESTYDRVVRMMNHLGLRVSAPPHKLECVLIEDHARFEAFATAQDGVRSRWLGGYYATFSNRVVFYHSGTAPEFLRARRQLDSIEEEGAKAGRLASEARRSGRRDMAEAYGSLAEAARADARRQRAELERQARAASVSKTLHEAAHLVAFNCGLQSRAHQYPFWMSEGLAACFEAAGEEEARRGRFGPEYENPTREREFAQALNEGALIPLEAFVEMVVVPGAHGGDEETARVMYAQGYAFFRWAYRYEKERLAALFMDIAAEPPGMIGPRRQGELFARRFGDPGALEARWLRDAPRTRMIAAGQDDAP